MTPVTWPARHAPSICPLHGALHDRIMGCCCCGGTWELIAQTVIEGAEWWIWRFTGPRLN